MDLLIGLTASLLAVLHTKGMDRLGVDRLITESLAFLLAASVLGTKMVPTAAAAGQSISVLTYTSALSQSLSYTLGKEMLPEAAGPQA